jgi:hypothetical protein
MLIIGNQKADLKLLGLELSHFGLNPNDWKVVREKSNFYRVHSILDQNFAFKGSTRRKGLKLAWQKLELASI